jgi:hypothetical protein
MREGTTNTIITNTQINRKRYKYEIAFVQYQ